MSRSAEWEPAWQKTEQAVLVWMVKSGWKDARLTPDGADGGVDIRASGVVAQVKDWLAPVGLREVQRTFGVAQAERCSALVFTTGRFTPKALEFANANQVGCLVFDPDAGTASPMTTRPLPASGSWVERQARASKTRSEARRQVRSQIQQLKRVNRELDRIERELTRLRRKVFAGRKTQQVIAQLELRRSTLRREKRRLLG